MPEEFGIRRHELVRDAAHGLTVYVSPYDRRPNIRRDISSRSDGQSVRCTRDERYDETF